MNLHKHILFIFYFLIIYFPHTTPTRNKNLVVSKSGLEDVSADSIGLQFFSIINNTSDEDYMVELVSDECCINSGETLDCDSVEIIGETCEVIRKGKAKTFKLVAPVLDPFERKGYCTIHVDSRPIDKRNIILRDTIKIDFDTGVRNINVTNLYKGIQNCENEDEDPLNDCNPVDCDTFYNGKKPLFDTNLRRCVEVPKCKGKLSGNDKFYDPITNRCIDGEHIDIDDIDYIKSIAQERHPKDVIIIESKDLNSIDNETHGLLNLAAKVNDQSRNNTAKTSIMKQDTLSLYVKKFFTLNKYFIIGLGMVLFSQCVLICSMIYCLVKKSTHSNKNIESKYFNNNQDLTITTPLISTSNMDIETAACMSEASSLDKKIKCYKACQKERNNNAKLSMSDDILSKCLNRRNWDTRTKSDTINSTHNFNKVTNFEWESKRGKQAVQEIITPDNIASQNEEGEDTIVATNEGPQDNYESSKIKKDDTDSYSSEKIIQCYDYSMVKGKKNNVTEMLVTDKTAASIVSAEKGAQAYFSNDSADDFISERGMVFLAGDGLSKYSFGSDSTPKSSLITSTSKTSKNHILKQVLSYLSKKSKALTTSDPGLKKSNAKDLELIHMSQASMFSSSASEYRNLNKIKLANDSRTSF